MIIEVQNHLITELHNHRIAAHGVRYDPAHYQQCLYEAAPMKRIHVIAISVLIGFISGVAVAPAKAASLSLHCETIAPYAGNVISVSTGNDLTVGGASFENQPLENDSNFSGANPLSTVRISRNEAGGWFLVVQSKVSDRTISAHCVEVE